MKIIYFSLAISIFFFACLSVPGQSSAPLPVGSPIPKISQTLAKNLEGYEDGKDVPRDRREQAYAKLLEGQKYVWRLNRTRSQNARTNLIGLARNSIQNALELDPTLAEGYTALAELEISLNPGERELEEAISLASIAVKIDPDNFGARRILARLFSFKSELKAEKLDDLYAEKAINSWKEVARLDPRNAEAWAFLSELYARSNRPDESINAIKKWLNAAPPLDTQFYQMLMGREANLSPESASLKLAAAFLKSGRTLEAIEALTSIVADDADNLEALSGLKDALESLTGEPLMSAVETLRRAVSTKPQNLALLNMLAEVLRRSGKLEEGASLLRVSAERALLNDKVSASLIYTSLGDFYAEADRFGEAAASFESALKLRGIDGGTHVDDEGREFAMATLEKIIRIQKNATRHKEVLATINRARRIFGKDDLFADRQLIAYHRESGRRPQALAAVRVVRRKFPDDSGFLRLEASLLTEMGKVDEAVALIKNRSTQKPGVASSPSAGQGSTSISVAIPPQDEFSDMLFISNLYSQANRGKEAAEAADRAFVIARGPERKQIARLTLATAQQMSGDFKAAETTLREILRQTPGNPIALNNLGYFLLERNERIDEAFILISQAVKIDPTNPSYLDSLGWAYFKLGKYAEAEEYLKDAARFDSGSATIQEHLGDVYEKQGKTDQAKIHWQAALKLASEVTDVNRLKAKIRNAEARTK